jgi:hypothetical protein
MAPSACSAAGTSNAKIKVLTIGSKAAPVEVGKKINGFYTVSWITKDRLVNWAIREKAQ